METKSTKLLILGAGIGGLGVATWAKKYGLDFLVIEGNKELPMNMHNGVHYLHSIPELPYEVDLKKITLTDGILYEDKIYHEPNLEFSLKYSEKVREIQHPSSIMGVGKRTEVFLPASNSMNDFLKDMYYYAGVESFMFGYWLKELDLDNKIAYFDKQGTKLAVHYENIISTLPVDKFRMMLNIEELNSIELKCNPVYITNFQVDKIVPNWMINLYIPDPNSPVYRASFLNNICSVESVRELRNHEIYQTIETLKMFHVNEDSAEKYTWNTGKVSSISMDDRMKLVDALKNKDIYSVGRFGLWNRKLLMDSTIKQAKMVVEHIINPKWRKLRIALSK